MSKIENAPNARVLRDDELDAVSGGRVNHQDFNIVSGGYLKVTMEDILVTSLKVTDGTSNTMFIG